MASLRVLQACKYRHVSKAAFIRSAGTLAPSAPLPLPAAEQEFRDKYHSRIGNRDIMGPGRNGDYIYVDDQTWPYPAIKWGENTGETAALVKKAQGDWKQLSLEEKKTLYRHSFCQTITEMQAPDHSWKQAITIFLVFMVLSCWSFMLLRNFATQHMTPYSINKEHQQAQMKGMAHMRIGLVSGVSSKWDYEKGEWKDAK